VSTARAPAVAQPDEVPEAIRALAMSDPDYVDLFTVTTSDATDHSPEEWARAAMEGISPTGRFLAWQVACGLRLEKGSSPDHVAGWRITGRGDDWIRVEASSWFMTAHGVLAVEEGRLSLANFVRYERPIAAFWWPAVSVFHRRAMPGVLRRGVRRMRRNQ
jgi:hypothetical protein